MKKVFLLLWLWVRTFCLYAQNNINYLEYFWNSDPGWGMATSVALTPDDTVDVSFSPITAGLTPGVNVLYVRAKDDSLKWTFPIQKAVYFYPDVPSNSQKIEYYIDTDPGLNNGIAVSTTGDSLIDQTFNVELNSVSHGLHLIGVRMRDQYGFWSITRTHLFYKYLNSGDDIVQLEYFIDSDPGQGLAIPIPITPGDSIDINQNIDLTGIQQGHHRLFIRAKSANGLWSFSPKHEFFMAGQNVVQLEYFWNNDPGVNMATNVPITASPVIDVNFSPITAGLTPGFNVLYVRGKNEGNIWSMPIQKTIYFYPDVPSNSQKIEYYIDTDPGLNNGIAVLTTGDSLIDQTFNIDLNSVSHGLHLIGVRMRDQHGFWSITRTHVFYKYLNSGDDIVQLEYFIDSDPGQGLAIPIPITPGDSIEVNQNIDLTGIQQGHHRLFIRAKSANGFWTYTLKHEFFMIGTQIVSAEYFWNSDPGPGLATNIPISPGSEIDVNFQPSTAGLSSGIQTLYIRAKNEGNIWSFPQQKTIYFTPNVLQNAAYFEYYIDTDPGPGNGTQVPISNDDNIDITFHLNFSNLSPGLHTLIVRSRDKQGFWGYPNRHSFMILEDGNYNIMQAEYYVDNDPGLGNAIPLSIAGSAPDYDISFSPSLTGLSFGIHTIYVRAKSNQGYWGETQRHPFMLIPTSNVNITQAEYYFDLDPSYGNGRPIAITANDSIDVVAPISLSGLTVGMHKLLVRAKDENGNWSHLFRKDVDVTATDNLFPMISTNPTSLTLNAPDCITTVTSGFFIVNTGNNPLNANLSESLSWLSINPTQVGVLAGDSVWINTVATPSSSLSSTNVGTISIVNNSSNAPTLNRSVTFNIPVGVFTMEVSHDSLDMGVTEVNKIISKNISLLNTSCSALNITSVTHSNSKFSNGPLISNPPTTLPGYTYLGFYNGHSYFKSNATNTWLAAESNVNDLMGQQGLTGYLASMNNSGENNWLSSVVSETEVWIGLRDADGTGNIYPCESSTSSNPALNCWRLSDGTTGISNNFSSWNSGEPNNSGGNEDFVNLFTNTNPTTTARNKWNDSNGTASMKHILEIVGGFPTNGTQNLTINFQSPTIGTFQDTMIIVSQAGSDTVYITAEAQGVPIFSFAKDTIQLAFLGCSMDTTVTTMVYNNGNGPLDWTVLTSNLPSWMSVVSDTNVVAINDSIEVQINISNPTILPGNYVYNIPIQSNDTITPIDTIKLHINILGDSSLTMQYLSVAFDTIPRNTSKTFTSNIINNGCTPVYVSATSFGTSVFEENVSTIYLPPYSSYPMVLKFQPTLAGDFYDTLTIVSNVGIQKFPVFGHASGALSYELSKLASNVNVQDCDGMTMDTIKLYNTGDGAGTWSLANIPQIPSWLMVNPQSGVLMAGDSVAIAIGYDATGLINNNFNHSIRINLTDPETPYVNIPVGMYVVGGSLMSLSQDTIDFGITYFTTERFDTLTITNTGCDTFKIKSITVAAPFTTNVSVLNVLPDSFAILVVQYDPNVIALHETTMYINGETDTLAVVLKGDAVQYPLITKLTKDSLIITMPKDIDPVSLVDSVWIIWGDQTGRRFGTYSIQNGSEMLFVPNVGFKAGEQILTTVKNLIKYNEGSNCQPFSDRAIGKVYNLTSGTYKIVPTNTILPATKFRLAFWNNDNLCDILYDNSNSSNSTINYLEQQPNNTFIRQSQFSSSGSSTFWSTPDFNNDGRPDIFKSHIVPSSVEVIYQNSNNGFINSSVINARNYSNGGEVFDFDANGYLDLYSVSGIGFALQNYISLYTQNNAGFSSFQEIPSGAFSTGYRMSDFNKDGLFDLYFTTRSQDIKFRLYKNNVSNFSLLSNQNNAESRAIYLMYDLNNDGIEDCIFNNGGNQEIILNSIGVPANLSNLINIYPKQAQYHVGDLNGDNYLDFFVYDKYNGTEWGKSNYSILSNSGAVNFSEIAGGFNFGVLQSSNLADIDNDGDLDFAFLDAQGKLWFAYNEDSNAELVLSQDTIQAIYTTCNIDTTYNISLSNIGDSTLVWQINLPTTIPSWMTIDTTFGQIQADSTSTFPIHVNTTGLLAGSYNYKLVFNHNDTSSYKDTVHINFIVQNDSIVLASVDTLDFGLVDINVNKTLPVTITNPGCADINLTAAINPSGIFTYTGAPVVVPAFGNKTIQVSANTATSGVTSSSVLQLTHNYGNLNIPLQAQACYVSPVTQIYEQVCISDSVGVDSLMLMNMSGCDSLVVRYYYLPGLSQNGLKLAMPFNGNANDISGNNNNGVVTTATLTADRFGNPNSAYKFLNNGDKIVVPASANITGSSPRAVSFWLKHEGTVGGIFNWGNYSTCNEFALAHFTNTPNMYRLQFWACDNDITIPNSNIGWHHFVMQYNGSILELYFDGVLQTSIPKSLNTSSTPITFGFRDGTTMKASLDDVIIYNRFLSQEEIQNLYTSQSAFVYNNTPTLTYSQSCDPIDVGLDTTILAGANQYECDSTIINVTSLTSPISNDGLVGYYTFDGNSNDHSGWGRNGTVNGATLTTDRHNKPNGAYSFDGVNDFINIPSSTQMNFGKISISGWIKLSQNIGSTQARITCRQGAGIFDNWGLEIFGGGYAGTNGGNDIVFHTSNGSTTTNYIYDSNLNLNQWYHVAAVNGNDSVRIYLDGIKKISYPTNGVLPTNVNYPILIGQTFNGGFYFPGVIDDLQYNKRVLSDAEIQALFNEQQSFFINAFTTCDTTQLGVDTTTYIGPNGCTVTDINITSLQSPISNDGLIAYYKLDGNAKDGSGYGNNGSINGAVASNDRWNQSASSLNFDGINDYVEVNNNAALNSYLTTGELSISYWVKPDIGNTTRDLIAKRPITDNGGFIVQANANQMGYDHVIFTNSGSKYVVIPYTQNQWQHISFTAKQNDAIRIYKNGVLAGSLSLAGNTFVGTNSNMRLMANTMALELFQKGNLDELMIHNRVLSPSEIVSLYNQHLTYAQSCDIADIGRDTIITTSSTACDSIQNIVTSLQNPVSSQDLVAFYSFDGNANDMSGWGNHGTVNGATLTTDRFGNPTGAYSFDGVNDEIGTLYKQQISNQFTVSAWVKTNLVQQANGNAFTIIQNRGIVNQGGKSITLRYWVSEGSWGIGYDGDNLYFGQKYIMQNDNQWMHITGVVDANGSSTLNQNHFKLYINGTLVSTSPDNGSVSLPFSGNGLIKIGRHDAWNTWFPGQIDDVQIFERALTPSEIQALYTNSNTNYTFNYFQSCDNLVIGIDTTIYAGAAQNGCDSLAINLTSLQSPINNNGLSAYYTFDGNSNDFSGYDRNATVTGAALTQDRHGNANRAYAFNGSNQYISTNHDASLNPGSAPYGVSMHYKTAATGQRELLMKTSVGAQEFVSIQQNDGNINATMVKASTTYTCNTTGLSLNDGKWHHLLFQRNPGNVKDTLRIYIDGILKKQEIYGAVINVSPQENMYIGIRKNWNGGGLQFPYIGDIDNVMILNRRLSDAEINNLVFERKGGANALVQRDTTHNYGVVMVGESAIFNTYITNTTCDTIVINSVNTNNSAFIAGSFATQMLPFTSQKISATFLPSGEVPYFGNLKVVRPTDTLTYILTGNGCNQCACPSEDVVLTTQGGLDAFVAYYGGCDSLPVSLTIAGTSSISNVQGLSFIKHIQGNLTISGNTALTNLNGFGNLAGLTGSFTMTGNTLIPNVDSLRKLVYIGQSLTINQNPVLNNLNGFISLTSIGQNISITNNASLNDCDAICPAFNNGIGGSITINNNPSECSSVTQMTMICDNDCAIGNLTLTTQAEVNTFVSKYNSCDTLIGNLTINGGTNISQIHGMSFIRQITGNLTLTGNANLTNMKGLQGLRKVTGNLSITGHVNMVSLDSLHHLSEILGSLNIQNNPVLNEINALSSLDTIGTNLTISNNVTLYNCSGICPIINSNSVKGNISITNNPNTCSSTDEVRIYCTPSVCPIVGNYLLKNQAEINAFVATFNSCDSLIGNLTITGGNDIISINTLHFLRYISGHLTVKNNFKITDMQGFSNLQKVGGDLTIEGNPLLNSLLHLDSLTHTGGFLKIQNNTILPNLSGLQFLVRIGNNLIVKNNNSLTNCSVICTLINNNVIQGMIDIASNPSPCSTNNQVNTVCTYGSLLSRVFVNITQDSIEEGSTFTFTVSTDYPPSDTLTVNLSSSNQTEVPVPAFVKILPNTTSRNVTVVLPNDNIPEKQKLVTITAGAPYLTSGSDSFVLTDDADMPDIDLIISLDTISEGAGLNATPAIVRGL